MENIIFKALVGSHAYGTNVEGSDKDIKGIFIQSPEDALEKGYCQQIEVSKDETYYELRRFIDLCSTGNPTMLELLYTPEDCILFKDPIFDRILEHKDKFLSKSCKHSFGGYAYAQVEKAKGLEKKMNWDKSRTVRKTVLDFCYVLEDKKSVPVKEWLKKHNYKQELCGLTAIPHWRMVYNLFYDHVGEMKSDNPKFKGISFNFKGIVSDEDKANDISLSEVPEYAHKETTMHFNKDEYQIHCKDYKSYTTWLAERNTQRYVDIDSHKQMIDGKNLLHCYRLIETGIEIARDKTINVRRPNAQFLIEIRKGKHDLETLLKGANEKIEQLYEEFRKSDLPDKPDRGFIQSLSVKLRREYYSRVITKST